MIHLRVEYSKQLSSEICHIMASGCEITKEFYPLLPVKEIVTEYPDTNNRTQKIDPYELT